MLVLIMTAWILGWSVPSAVARPYADPAIRYENAESEALGGVTLPITTEIGNDLMNNPAALARNTKFKVEAINLNIEGNDTLLSTMGTNSLNMTGLGGMTGTLNQNPGVVAGGSFSNLSTVSWGGLGIGLLYSKSGRAVSDGTTVHYETVNQFVPTVGYGLRLARGVVRIGYSLQYVNESAGTASAPSNSSAAFSSGVAQGHGLSHNASVNFVFPFQYTPTFSIIGRNLGGVHYMSNSMLMTSSNSTGIPQDEKMSVDMAFNFTVRISGTFKSFWFFQYKDATGSTGLKTIDRLNSGLELDISKSVVFRVGASGIQPSLGIGYKSESSEINLAWYHEQDTLPGAPAWDTRYALQYKIYFQDKNTRDRDREEKVK